jgi:hypothetical protein
LPTARDRHGAAALLGKAIDLREAEPRSQSDLLRCEIGLERSRHHFRRHARAGIGQCHGNEIAHQPAAPRIVDIESDIACRHMEPAALRHGITRVHSDVEQRHLEFREIDKNRPQLCRHLDLHLDVGPEHR